MNNMNLLDSVLSVSNASEYVENLRKFGIDAYTLKLLRDEDLQIVGIKDEIKRKALLKNASNLQVVAESPVEVLVNKKYIELVLRQMSTQLNKHLASLSIAMQREDVVVCNIRLTPATKCLQNCVNLLENELATFETDVISGKKKRNKNSRLFIQTGLTACLLICSYQLYRLLA